MIIGLLGAKDSGKSSVANYLSNNFGFKKISFANPIKDICCVLFGWDRQMMEGETPEHRLWRETPDEKWSKILNIPNFSPRYAMTYIGTELFRNQFHKDIWILSLINKLDDNENYLVSDCRQINETLEILKRNGTIIRIERGPLPNWTETAIKATSGDATAVLEMKALGVHENEYEWLSAPYNHLLKNDSDLPTLFDNVSKIYESILK
jgi:hypothetical protein